MGNIQFSMVVSSKTMVLADDWVFSGGHDLLAKFYVFSLEEKP